MNLEGKPIPLGIVTRALGVCEGLLEVAIVLDVCKVCDKHDCHKDWCPVGRAEKVLADFQTMCEANK
jgi:hypothetical protein